jgi:hypothetical protein
VSIRRRANDRAPTHGLVIRTVINNSTFDGSTKDPMQQAVRDALIAFIGGDLSGTG